jgi:hypothetical protein
MLNPIKRLEYEDIKRILKEFDERVVFKKTNVVPDEHDLYYELQKYVEYKKVPHNAVLGIDIFQYSSYSEFKQTLIPYVFKTMFEMAAKLCLTNHAYIFQGYRAEDFDKQFISTGDGGFLILDTPLHALLFAANLAIILRVYNSFNLFPKLRKIIGGLTFRYALTYDHIYYFDRNYYGRAIINNARILIKDELNRCLIDEHVHTWFTTNIGGLESLQVLTIDDVANILTFKENYAPEFLEQPDVIFGKETSREIGIINSDVLKIGKIKSKETDLTIYNLHIQISIWLTNDDNPSQKKRITISLGNLNTTGI